MNLSSPFILRPIMTVLASVTILFLGLLGFFELPVSNLPDVDFPVITVTAQQPGANPETMAKTVASPLETEFMTIPGITNVTSSNTLGVTNIVLEFEADKDIDSAAQDVEAAITRASPRLPPDLPLPPNYKKINPSDSPIMYIALTSDTLTLAELHKYGRTFIGQRLSTIPGVAQVTTYGAPFAVRAQVNPGSLALKGITLHEVAQAIRNASPELPTGQIDGKNTSSIINSDAQLQDAAGYKPVIVKYQNSSPVRLFELGEVIDSVNNLRIDIKYIDRETIQPTVVLIVQRQPGANTVAVSNAVKAYLPKLIDQLPASISLNVVFDLAESIINSVHEVELTLIIALFLVMLVVFLYLGNFRDTIIPSIAMPMSILVTFWFMYRWGYSLDNLSLLALTLATGFIIDDAIVVLENIVRHVEMGESRYEAALKGSAQISFTILSMTLSLAAVFIPLLFMPGLVGKILHEFAMTLVIVILASGVISLTLTPMLCSRFVSISHGTSWASRFSKWINSSLLNVYDRTLKWSLVHKKLMLFIGALSVALSAYFFWLLPKDFLPDDDIGFIIGYSQAQEGTSYEKMFRLQEEINNKIRENPEVASFVSIAGTPQMRQGIFFIHLVPMQERKPVFAIIQELYPELNSIPGLQVFLKNIPLINLSAGVQTKGAYQYTLQSLNTEDLYAGAELFIDRLMNLNLIQAVSSDFEIKTPQLNIEILRDEASRLGINAREIEETLGYAYSGGRVSTIQTPYDQYDVILELLPKFQHNVESLNDLYMRSSSSSSLVPLNTVSKWKEGLGPSSVNHLLQFPAVTINFNLAPNVPLGTAMDAIEQIAREVLPSNVIGQPQGAALKFQETIQSVSILLVIAIFAMYIILGILYESYIHPLTILSSLPPAILGGLLTLYLLNLPMSLYAYLGFFLLIGIVKKNGIMMVDYALDYRKKEGEEVEKSIYHAALVRFRPIMMTTFATIMGALPVAIGIGSGGEARRPLGLVMIGGLILSQLITLYLTPVIYIYLDRWNEKFTPKDIEKPVT